MTFLLNLNSLTKQFLQYISSSNSREIDGRTPLVLLTLLLFKLPGLDEPFTLNTLALLPFQLLGDNSQERNLRLAVTHIVHFLYQKFFTLDTKFYIFWHWHSRVRKSFNHLRDFLATNLQSVEPSERVFGRYFRSTV